MTPLEQAPDSIAAGRSLFFKREDLHELGAFKWRGALPCVEQYRSRGAGGVVTASTGNHGAATCWAASRLGLPSIVFAPRDASRSKLALIEAQGGQVRRVGKDLDEAKVAGQAFAADQGFPFFEDGAEPAQYQGYGEIAREILDQCLPPPEVVIVPVGNGALIAGIGMALEARSVKTRLVGVAAKEAPVMALSFEKGRAVPCERMATFADGLAVRVAIPSAVAVVNRVVSEIVLVSEREIARAIGVYASIGIRVEGAGAAALAALAALGAPPRIEGGGPIVLIVTGGNVDEEIWRRAIDDPDSFPD